MGRRQRHGFFSLDQNHRNILLEIVQSSNAPISRRRIVEELVVHPDVNVEITPEMRSALQDQVTWELKLLRADGVVFLVGSGSNTAYTTKRGYLEGDEPPPANVVRKHLRIPPLNSKALVLDYLRELASKRTKTHNVIKEHQDKLKNINQLQAMAERKLQKLIEAEED